MNNFHEQLKKIEKKERIIVENKLTYFQRLKNKFQIFKVKIALLTKKLFFKDKPQKEKEVSLETVIVIDMGKIEYIDLEKLLSSYDEKSQVLLIAKGFNKFDTERVSKLPYDVEYIQVRKKVSIGKQLKIEIKKLRAENKYRVIAIKGRGPHLLEKYIPLNQDKKSKTFVKQEGWEPFKSLFKSKISYPTLKEIEEQKRSSTLNNHLILWDIENISYNNIAKIFSKLNEINSFYCVSVEPLSEKVTKGLFLYTLHYNIRIKVGHLNSDDEIVRIIEKEYKKYKMITIISSDTDFVPIIKKLLKSAKKVQIIGRDSQKKGILMKNNIADENLKIITI